MPRKTNQAIDLGFLTGEGAHTDLSSMFAASVVTETEMQHATLIEIDRLLNNPYQPRTDMRRETIEELAQVIRSQGFQGVLIARPHPTKPGYYELTAGHRRRDAARRAGLSTLPVVVHDLTDEEMVTLAVTENIQREDLTPLEEGRVYLMMSHEMGYTHEQIAREIGKKRGWVENRLRLARAPLDVQALVERKPDSIRAVANLIKVKDPHDRAEMIDGLLSGQLTVEDLPALVELKNGKRDAQKTIDAARKALDELQHKPITKDVQPGDMSPHVAELKSEAAAPQPALAAQAKAAAHDSQGAQERKAARLGNTKLMTVLRYLNAYREQSAARGSLSEQERASLALIKAAVDELYDRHAAGELPS